MVINGPEKRCDTAEKTTKTACVHHTSYYIIYSFVRLKRPPIKKLLHCRIYSIVLYSENGETLETSFRTRGDGPTGGGQGVRNVIILRLFEDPTRKKSTAGYRCHLHTYDVYVYVRTETRIILFLENPLVYIFDQNSPRTRARNNVYTRERIKKKTKLSPTMCLWNNAKSKYRVCTSE